MAVSLSSLKLMGIYAVKLYIYTLSNIDHIN